MLRSLENKTPFSIICCTFSTTICLFGEERVAQFCLRPEYYCLLPQITSANLYQVQSITLHVYLVHKMHFVAYRYMLLAMLALWLYGNVHLSLSPLLWSRNISTTIGWTFMIPRGLTLMTLVISTFPLAPP